MPDGHQVHHAPDPSPAQHLCDLLADARRDGEDFEEAFGDCVAYVLECIGRRRKIDRMEWSNAFHDLEQVWRLGWDRQPVPGALVASLLNESEPF